MRTTDRKNGANADNRSAEGKFGDGDAPRLSHQMINSARLDLIFEFLQLDCDLFVDRSEFIQ